MLPLLASKQASVEAGIGGEKLVADTLRKYTFPFQHHIFHDLSLTSNSSFQMDHFFHTPYYGVIFETKNISGSLEFRDSPPQLVRTKEDGHLDGFESPVVQLNRNYELLSAWLKARGILFPLYRAVILAYPKQMVTKAPAGTTLLYASMVPDYLRGLPLEGKKLDKSVFQWVADEFLRSHRFYVPKPVAESYGIPFEDFQMGGRCQWCGRIGLVKLPRTWGCPYCKRTDNLAHHRNLDEWFLVFKRTITNRECREFLGIGDKYTANRILSSAQLFSMGTFKDRYYLKYQGMFKEIVKQ